MNFDFTVIGSGIAGLTSSLVFAKYGKVVLLTKGKLSDGSTNWAQGGIACVVEEKDNWKKHFQDTLIAGAYHNDKKAVEFLVKHAPMAIDWLSNQGVPFEKVKGQYKTGREGGHSHNRILHATDFTGKEIEAALIKKVRKNKNIEIWENVYAKELLVDRGKCYGVKVIGSVEQQNTVQCFSRATILATGGVGQLYQWTTNPYVSTGDGIALARQAGAKIKDMEFIQFHPTALKHGESPLFLISEALRGEGAYLVRIKNTRGERFMKNHDERLELAPRDIVARAIYSQQQKGYEVFLDIRHKEGKFLQKRFPNIYNELKKRGFDLATDLVPVTPAAHFSCGGVETDLYGRTNIKGLFAFGEVAATGVHGANRLASNSLLESVVFPLQLLSCGSPPASLREALRAGCRSEIFGSSTSGESLHNTPEVSLPPSAKTPGRWPNACLPARQGLLPGEYCRKRFQLEQLMWQKVGIVRKKKDLKEAKRQIEKGEKELENYEGKEIKVLELKNMLLTARLITKAALKRKKSLGVHWVNG